jgi:predicted alpha/beta hydrolase family esterase
MLVITVGGLGFSQMGDLRRAIQRQCPKADVVSAGFWDAYKADLVRMIRKSPHDHVILVGHSLGCQTVARTASEVKKIDLAVLIEPAGGDIRLPTSVGRTLWYQRSDFSLVWKAKVVGASAVTIKGGHDDITRSAELIGQVVRAINQGHDAGWKRVASDG